MSAFQQIMIDAITDYKALLKRNFTASICSSKFKTLGIKRKQLQNLDERELYEILIRITRDLEDIIITKAPLQGNPDDFFAHLKQLMTNFNLENGRVVHIAQKAAWALVTAIQLAALPEHSLTDNILHQIHECAKLVARYGNPHQIHLFGSALKKHRYRHLHFFSQIQHLFETHMQQIS